MHDLNTGVASVAPSAGPRSEEQRLHGTYDLNRWLGIYSGSSKCFLPYSDLIDIW